MGQGNQCQSQGATQAPTISQMGHIGQGMGRDRGQDFQVDTLGNQGHVYVVVPQTELADQFDIQGTFALSQEYHLNLDASYSCLLQHLVWMFRV